MSRAGGRRVGRVAVGAGLAALAAGGALVALERAGLSWGGRRDGAEVAPVRPASAGEATRRRGADGEEAEPLAQAALSEAALARVREATVFIEVYYREVQADGRLADNEVGPATGTGFVISEDGLVLTNRHVVDALHEAEPPKGTSPAEGASRARHFRASSVKVRLHSGTPRSRAFDAQVLRTCDDPDDLALLRISARAALVAFPIADALHDPRRAPTLRETERVWAAGFPLGHAVEEALAAVDLSRNPSGLELSIRDGTVAALRRGESRAPNAIEHTCAIDRGNSGGPLVDARGNVVGINTWGIGKAGYAIPIEAALRAFPHTLLARGATTVEGARRPGRALAVEPAGQPTETTFPDLVAAVQAARAGDTIELPEGDLEVSVSDWVGDLHVPAGVWIRGAGVARTRLRMGDVRLWIGSAERAYAELSDLTLVPAFDWPELAVPYGAGPETYIHDARWRGLLLGHRSSPSLVACEMGALTIEAGATPRLERCAATRIQVAGADTAPALRGSTLEGLQVRGGARPALVGCSVAAWASPGAAILVAEGSARLTSCTLGSMASGGPLLEVGPGAEARVSGSRFRSDGEHAVWVDVGGRAELDASLLDVGGGPAVRAAGSASLEGCCVRYSGYRGLPFAPPPFAAPGWDPSAGWPAFGVVLDGAAARATLRGNLFVSPAPLAAVASRNGAPEAVDGGGNDRAP